MTARHLLYLATDGVRAYAWQRNRLSPEGSFPATENGLAEFSAYLQRNRKTSFQILANLPSESHHLETIPYLKGEDRRALIARKLEQLSFDPSLAMAVSLGYEKARRKNERLLLASQGNPADLDPWLSSLSAAEVSLAGIYSLSQFGGSLLRRCSDQVPERCLLLTVQDGSVRESFIVRGETLFSRLLFVPEAGSPAVAGILAVEAERLRLYLASQGHIDRKDSLPIFALADSATIEQMKAAPADSDALAWNYLDNQAAARKLGLEIALRNNFSELLFLQLLGLEPPRRQFAGEDLRENHRLRQARRMLAAAGTIPLAIAVLFAGKQFLDSRSQARETAGLMTRENDLLKRQAELLATLPQSPLDHDTLQRIGNDYEQLRRTQRQPIGAYLSLSRALAEAPEMEVDGIDWKTAPGATATSTCCEESITVQGHVKQAGDVPPRQGLIAFRHFLRTLENDSSQRIQVHRHPFDQASRQTPPTTAQGMAGQEFAILITRGKGQ